MFVHMSDSPNPGDVPSRPPTRRRRFAPSVDLRPGEWGICYSLFGIHFLILAFQYVSKSVRQSVFIDSLGATQLPFVYLLVALCSYPLLWLYGRLVDRWNLERVFAVSSLVVAASLVVFWWLFTSVGTAQTHWVSVAFYLWIAIVGILLVSQFWSYASQRLDPRQARRLFGLVGAGGVLGSIAGGQIARFSAYHHDTYRALWAAALLLVAQAAWVVFMGRRGCIADHRRLARVESLEKAKDGFDLLRGSRYLRLIAMIMLLSAMVAQVIDLQFSWVVEQNTSSLEDRTAVFGNLYSIMGVAAFLFQVLFTGRIHRRLGVGFAMRVLPSTNGLGTVLFAAAAFMAPALLWPAVWLLKIGENGLRYSLDQATRELLFLPVPPGQRTKAKAFIDVFVQRAAKGLAALALMAVTFGFMTVPQTAVFSLVWIALWWSYIGKTRESYVAAFRESLHRDLEVDEALRLDDPGTLEVLFEGLGSSDDREVLHSLEILAGHGRGHLVPPLLLHHDDPAVRIRTLQILAEVDRRDATPLIEKLLLDDDTAVRVAATRALAALSSRDVGQLMIDRLHDPDPRIRGAAIGYLAGLDNAESAEIADRALGEMLADGSADVRLEAARSIGDTPLARHQGLLVQLLYDGDDRVVRAAVATVRRLVDHGAGSTQPQLFLPILVSHLRHRKLKHDARDALVAFGEPAIPALQHFMNDPQEDVWVRRALPKTIAHIGGGPALMALVESLSAPDPFLRRKVIEALGTVRAGGTLLCPTPGLIIDEIAADCHGYLRALLDLQSLEEQGGGGHLLERLLADRMGDHAANIFNLLALLHRPRDIRAAHRGLISQRPGLRAHALEYLDNLLTGEVRQMVFAVIDDIPREERLRQAQKLFDLVPSTARTTLRRLATLRMNGDSDAVWLTAAALHYIVEYRLEDLYPVVHQVADHKGSPLLAETTQFLVQQIAA